MDALLSFAGISVYPYGLAVAAGSLLSLCLMGVLGYLRRLPAGTVRVFGLLGVPLGILLARLVFCLFNLEAFLETWRNPWLMLRFWDGGFSMTGLLAGLIFAALLTSRIMNVRLGHLLDCMCVSLGLLFIAVYAAEAFTELGVGKVVASEGIASGLPWLYLKQKAGINVEYRMAVYRYEAIAAGILLVAFLSLFLRKRGKKALRPGDLTLCFFSAYGAAQTLLESMRDDGHLLVVFLRVGQLSAVLLPLIAAFIFSKRYLHLHGKSGHRILWTWLALLVCIAGIVLLEFALDGRLGVGTFSMGLAYALMAGLCLALGALPCSLCHTLNQRLYLEERFQIKIEE